jgi:hypothetical protein
MLSFLSVWYAAAPEEQQFSVIDNLHGAKRNSHLVQCWQSSITGDINMGLAIIKLSLSLYQVATNQVSSQDTALYVH